MRLSRMKYDNAAECALWFLKPQPNIKQGHLEISCSSLKDVAFSQKPGNTSMPATTTTNVPRPCSRQPRVSKELIQGSAGHPKAMHRLPRFQLTTDLTPSVYQLLRCQTRRHPKKQLSKKKKTTTFFLMELETSSGIF